MLLYTLASSPTQEGNVYHSLGLFSLVQTSCGETRRQAGSMILPPVENSPMGTEQILFC